MIAILDNLRSAHNVGSIFRTADALGVEKLYLVGTTPTPTDRFGRPDPKISKVALGAEKNIAWEHVDDLDPLLKKLRKAGSQVIAVEQHKDSVDLLKIKTDIADLAKIALVFGPEVDGLSKKTLKLADQIVEIPMQGKKESLNVAVTFGIIAYFLKTKD